jgi:hypothetical protein
MKKGNSKPDKDKIQTTVDDMIEFADDDDDGKINFAEFKKILLFQRPEPGSEPPKPPSPTPGSPEFKRAQSKATNLS